MRLWALLAASLLVPLSACDEDTQRTPLPDWSDGYETEPPDAGDAGMGEPRPDAPEDAFALLVSDDVEYPTRLRRAGSDLPCAVGRGEPREVVDCVLDVNELDLAALGFAIDASAPAGMCDYIEYQGFLFENWEVGVGPTAISYTLHEDGSYSDEIGTELGQPDCEYDHTREGGPNCCIGSYTLTVKSMMSGETSVSRGSWQPDKLGLCYEGGAFYRKGVKLTADGIPVGLLSYLGGRGGAERYEFEGISGIHSTNLPLANHYRPEDHDGDMPAAYGGLLSYPFYSFICVDDAEEWRAHLRLFVREWNEEQEFEAEGDPDTTGFEADWDTPINDREDFADRTPGSLDFPKLPLVRR